MCNHKSMQETVEHAMVINVETGKAIVNMMETFTA